MEPAPGLDPGDPETGRFLQTDPIGYEDQMNLYAYVGNDPLNATDPTGMCGAEHSNPKECVYGIPGAGSADNPANSELRSLVEEHGGVFEDVGQTEAERKIREYKEAYPDAELHLLGQSRGGGEAVDLANSLGDGESPIKIDSLIVFDPHRMLSGSFKIQNDNVLEGVVFYQENPKQEYNPFRGSPVLGPNMNNFNLTGQTAPNYVDPDALYWHNDIVGAVLRTERFKRVIDELLP